MDKNKALKVAMKAAVSSGKILLQKYKKVNFIKQKKSEILDFVTEADLSAEKRIKEIISKAFPKHSILAEESGMENKKSDYLWAIDPLCGTANFINQIGLFNVSIALLLKRKPVLGVVYDPIREDLYSAILNKGTYLNGEKIYASGVKKLSQAVVAFNLGKTKEKRRKWQPFIGKLILSCYKLREFGSNSLGASFLAAGKIDVVIDLPDPWDAAGSMVIVQEAGGKVTDWQGNEWNLESKSFVASNGKIHKQILKVLSK